MNLTMHICIHIYVYIVLSTHTHTHTHTYIYIHTHTHKLNLQEFNSCLTCSTSQARKGSKCLGIMRYCATPLTYLDPWYFTVLV